MLASRVRAQRSYPTGFALDLVGSLLIGITEFGEVWVIFHNVTVLGGLTSTRCWCCSGCPTWPSRWPTSLWATSTRCPTYIRAGTLDAFYLRPLPVLTQLMTSELDCAGISRIVVAVVALAIGLEATPCVVIRATS